MTQVNLLENWLVDLDDLPTQKQLPLYLQRSYHLSLVEYADVNFVLAKPLEKVNLATLRKQRLQIMAITGLEFAWYFDSMNWYTKEMMLKERIPFVERNRQAFLPFLGIALVQDRARELRPCEKISFMTQRLLLTAIYNNWQEMTVTNAAKSLSVSKMSVTRCFDELESLNISLIKKQGRTRKFIWEHQSEDLWKLTLRYLRNPVLRSYSLREPFTIDKIRLSGISAVAYYSMLSDNNYPTLAVTQVEEREYGLRHQVCLPDEEQPAMIIQVLPYEIEFGDSKAIDPLSAILSLTEEEKNDPRIETAIDDILQEVFR